jgi:tRNA-Thr(GGU) m(6)t(6)A37 methyltransferase TsaA
MDCPLPVIGVVRTAHTSPETTPVQSSLNLGEEGVLELDERYVEGLEGLAGFDYLWLITWLGRDGDTVGPDAPLKRVPYLLQRQQREMGVFATRGPRRINPIGLSLVRLVEVDGHTVRFAGVDLVDGTPVIDLKPYAAQLDRPSGKIRSGWFDEVDLSGGMTPTDLAP